MDANSNTAHSTFREFLPDLNSPRFAAMQKQNAHEFVAEFLQNKQPPWLHALYLHWRKLFEEPYRGITTDGTLKHGLFDLQNDGIPIELIVDTANSVLCALDEEQRRRTVYHVDSPEWRSWSNPEYLLSNKGIRLDEVHQELRSKVLKILEVTLSPEGYQKAIIAMKINHFLGELVQSPSIMNEFSYNFVLFGEPSTSQPWGFSLYGHHLCINIFLYKTQIIASPCFTGAEPNLIDEGPYRGSQILRKEEVLGLQLMQSLSAEKQAKAQIYKLMKDPKMPWGRWNHDDQRHLCGAYRDNRIVPYEGLVVSKMTTTQQNIVLNICKEYVLYLPAKARRRRLDMIKSWFHETYWCWIGGYGDNDAFYYRIQSPVVIIEFDHHSGVYLTNSEPAKFHIHTILRTPNGGDYGMALRPLIPPLEQGFTWEGAQ
ncbi:hypothetical protein PT974_04838 [Cladobotryum mycophilum]|uniref:DUF3500 domain-containing protein n=1 Tax=Cladobotryum mycophilum TaxID=491253 RepID=A0ABR0SQI3_9HYPO